MFCSRSCCSCCRRQRTRTSSSARTTSAGAAGLIWELIPFKQCTRICESYGVPPDEEAILDPYAAES